MVIDNLKINYRLKNKTLTNPQIKNRKKGLELRLIRHRHITKIQNMCI